MSQFNRTGRALSYPQSFFTICERFGADTLLCSAMTSKKQATGTRQLWYSFGKSLRLRATRQIPCDSATQELCERLAQRLDQVEFILRDYFGMLEELSLPDVRAEVSGKEEALAELRKLNPSAQESDLWFLIIRSRDMSPYGRLMRIAADQMLRDRPAPEVPPEAKQISAEEALKQLGY